MRTDNKVAGAKRAAKRTATKLWTVRTALAAVPYLRRVVRDMREAYCRLAHARRVSRQDPYNGYLQKEVERAEAEVRGYQKELDDAGVLAYQHYARGILLLPSVRPSKREDAASQRKNLVYLIWRDTRPGVNSYCTVDELHGNADLIACERDVPSSWGKA